MGIRNREGRKAEWSDKAKSIVHGAEYGGQMAEDRIQRTEYRGQKIEVGSGKSERLEDRCQVLFLLHQLIQPSQLINPIYS